MDEVSGNGDAIKAFLITCMLAGIRIQHDFKFSKHFLNQNAVWFVSQAKKIIPASISAQPMLASFSCGVS